MKPGTKLSKIVERPFTGEDAERWPGGVYRWWLQADERGETALCLGTRGTPGDGEGTCALADVPEDVARELGLDMDDWRSMATWLDRVDEINPRNAVEEPCA